jgi:hypothetical protein
MQLPAGQDMKPAAEHLPGQQRGHASAQFSCFALFSLLFSIAFIPGTLGCCLGHAAVILRSSVGLAQFTRRGSFMCPPAPPPPPFSETRLCQTAKSKRPRLSGLLN